VKPLTKCWYIQVIRASETPQRLYLTWARPAASVVALAAFGGLALASPQSSPGALVFLLLGLSLAAAVVYVVAARSRPLTSVLRVALFVDTALIAAMAAALDRGELLALGFFWPMVLAAFLLTPRDALFFTVLGAVGASLVPVLGGLETDALTIAVQTTALVLVGGVLVLLAHSVRESEQRLARERALDAVALRIAERIRSSLDIENVLGQTAEEIARACDAARGLVRAIEPDLPLYQWTRTGVEPVGEEAISVPVRRVAGARVPVVVDEPGRADAELQRNLRSVGAVSLVGYPVAWRGRVVAVLGLHDDRPRNWEQDALPLLGRIASQVGAALAQADHLARQLEAVERMQELARMREQFVANVSHELRTPLTSTIGFLRTLERDDFPGDDSERRRFLAIARAEAERLGRLVEDLLEFARLGRDTLPLRIRPIGVAEVVRRAARGLTPANGRLIRVEVAEDLVAQADEDRLLQIVSNLLVNALAHGHGAVTLRGFEDNGRVVLEVSDEGPGMPSERAAELFLPFARASESSSGTGLGLAIARALTEAHGGSLTYRPGNDGLPHAFVVSLPRERADARA
jgi:signal transduction histidine kinase